MPNPCTCQSALWDRGMAESMEGIPFVSLERLAQRQEIIPNG